MVCNGFVKIKYNGRYGNQLFTYFTARLFADKYNLNLLDQIDSVFFQIKSPTNYGSCSNNNLKTYVYGDDDFDEETQTFPYHGQGIYIFDGYFQNEDVLYGVKDKIKGYLDLTFESVRKCSLHVRRDDYYAPNKRHLIVSTDYYIDCIKKHAADYEQIDIICDKLRYPWEKRYMRELTRKIEGVGKIPVHKENTISDDILGIMQSSCIITSNSTFCFWATFFSQAKIVSFPHLGVDVLPSGKTQQWSNNPKVFKYFGEDRFVSTLDYSNNVLDYFEDMD